jgi:hypothetical protein
MKAREPVFASGGLVRLVTWVVSFGLLFGLSRVVVAIIEHH